MKQIACRGCFHDDFLHFDETGLFNLLLGTFVASEAVLEILHPRAGHRQIDLESVAALHEVLPVGEGLPLCGVGQVEGEGGQGFAVVLDLEEDGGVLVALGGGVVAQVGLDFEELVEPGSAVLEVGLRVAGGDHLLLLGLPDCLQRRPTPPPLLAPHLLQLDLEGANVIFHVYTQGQIGPTHSVG